MEKMKHDAPGAAQAVRVVVHQKKWPRPDRGDGDPIQGPGATQPESTGCKTFRPCKRRQVLRRLVYSSIGIVRQSLS
jgi:hypothetical protein